MYFFRALFPGNRRRKKIPCPGIIFGVRLRVKHRCCWVVFYLRSLLSCQTKKTRTEWLAEGNGTSAKSCETILFKREKEVRICLLFQFSDCNRLKNESIIEHALDLKSADFEMFWKLWAHSVVRHVRLQRIQTQAPVVKKKKKKKKQKRQVLLLLFLYISFSLLRLLRGDLVKIRLFF